MLPRRSDWWHVWLFNTFGNDTKGLGGRCGLRPSAPSSSLRQLATSSRCYPVHGLLPEKYSQWREKNTLLDWRKNKRAQAADTIQGLRLVRAGTLITRLAPAHLSSSTRLTRGLCDMSRVTRGLESVTQTRSVSFVVKFRCGVSLCGDRSRAAGETQHLFYLFRVRHLSHHQPLPLSGPADISNCFSMLNNIRMYSLAVRVSGRRLLWFPSLAPEPEPLNLSSSHLV